MAKQIKKACLGHLLRGLSNEGLTCSVLFKKEKWLGLNVLKLKNNKSSFEPYESSSWLKIMTTRAQCFKALLKESLVKGKVEKMKSVICL